MLEPGECARATAIVRRAGVEALRWFGADPASFEARRKDDGSAVSDADVAIERLLRADLAEAFPGDGIVGEELGVAGGSTGRRWLIDPIDETEPFLHGAPLFSVLLSLVEESVDRDGDDRVVASFVSLPTTGSVMAGALGMPTTLDGRPVHVAAPGATGDRPLILTGDLDGWPPAALTAARVNGARIRTWGGGLAIALVASGRADAYVDVDLDPWDIAPAAVLIPGAGGRFDTLDGSGRLDAGSLLIGSDDTVGMVRDWLELTTIGTDRSVPTP